MKYFFLTTCIHSYDLHFLFDFNIFVLFYYTLYFHFLLIIEKDEKYGWKTAPNKSWISLLLHTSTQIYIQWEKQLLRFTLIQVFVKSPLSFLRTKMWKFGKQSLTFLFFFKKCNLDTKLLGFRSLNLMVYSILREKWSPYPKIKQTNKLYKSTQKEITLMTFHNVKKCQRQMYK